MKQLSSIILLLFAMVLPAMAINHTYAPQSVLNQGHWVKIRIAESGVCRMSYAELRQAGLDPTQVRVFGYGGAMLTQDFEKPRVDDLPQVPVYRGADYILFYVQGSVSWNYTGKVFEHTRNPYSDYGYYFLTDTEGEMSLPSAVALSGSASHVTTYTDLQLHEVDRVNLIDITNGTAGGGRDFYGEQLTMDRATLSFTMPTPNAVAGGAVSAKVVGASFSSEYSKITATINQKSGSFGMMGVEPTDFYTKAYTGKTTISTTAVAGQQSVSIVYTPSNSTALGWLDYVELSTLSNLHLQSGYLSFRSTTNYNTSTLNRYSIQNADNSTIVWDVTDRNAIRQVPVEVVNNAVQFLGSNRDGVHEYVAVNPNASGWVSATVVGDVACQNLHALSNIDYVIVCPRGYEAISGDLARAHQQKQAITWAVVTDEQVYNEFSSGTPDATAIRWLMKMLYDRAASAVEKPKWLCLMGDGSFDNRKLLATSPRGLLVTYQSANSTNEVKAYATDDYFGFLDNNEGKSDVNATMDIGIGRLPVATTDEAREVVDKLIRYMNNDNCGKWKNQLLFLSDDGDNGLHITTAEAGAERVRLRNPDFVVNKIYLDAYPQEVNAAGESYPIAKNRLDNLLQDGVLFFNYSGHGGYNGITNEGMLRMGDIQKMNNRNLAFWMFATCSFSHFDALERSSGELAVLNPNGGAIATLSACRTVYASQNTIINRNLCDTLFGHSDVYHYDITLGDATRLAKNMTGSDENKMAYVLLGDPAIRLNYPTDYHVETVSEMDTLKALSVHRVEGRVTGEDGLTATEFSGTVDITIYDKMQTITTRDNDAAEPNKKTLSYNDYPSIIFTGSTRVNEGEFSFSFMTPRDIRYNYGNGRIVYYAYSDSLPAEAVGHDANPIVGGAAVVDLLDTVGPDIQLYLNTQRFEDGDVSYETPRFFATIYDENGINTSGTGIGHDLLLVIDDDPKLTYVLNSCFIADTDSYQRGQVSYLISELADGDHHLSFRAWDLMNNSSTKTLRFRIEHGIDPNVTTITTYPDEGTGIVNIEVGYDQPDGWFTSETYLYDISGHLIWSHQEDNPGNIAIDYNQLGLSPGVYIYNVRMKSATGSYVQSAGKIIINH